MRKLGVCIGYLYAMSHQLSFNDKLASKYACLSLFLDGLVFKHVVFKVGHFLCIEIKDLFAASCWKLKQFLFDFFKVGVLNSTTH